MVCLVNNQESDRVKRPDGVFAHAQRLDHRNNKGMVEFATFLLNSSDCRSWTKLRNSFGPLVCQKFFVNHNESPNTKTCCKSKSTDSFAKSDIERKNSISFVCVDRLYLDSTKLAREWDVYLDRLGTLIARRLAKVFPAVKLWDAQVLTRLFEHLERRRTKAERVFDCPYSQVTLHVRVWRDDVARACE